MPCCNRRWDICLLCLPYAGSLEEKKELERIQYPHRKRCLAVLLWCRAGLIQGEQITLLNDDSNRRCLCPLCHITTCAWWHQATFPSWPRLS